MTISPSEADGALYELDALRAIAARVIDAHVNDHGSCAICGCAFPCSQACLAEHNLAVCDCPPPEAVMPRRD